MPGGGKRFVDADYIKKAPKNLRQIIFVSDSCAVFADKAPLSAKKGFVLLGKRGGTIKMIENGGFLRDRLIRYIRKYPHADVILNLGSNGNHYPVSNAKRCIRDYNYFIKRFPKTKFYVASITPSEIHVRNSYKNSNTARHASVLKKAYQKKGIYIDVYHYLLKHCNYDMRHKRGKFPAGYGLFDTLHLNATGSTILLKYLRKSVK